MNVTANQDVKATMQRRATLEPVNSPSSFHNREFLFYYYLKAR